jgi:hypothetical protein
MDTLRKAVEEMEAYQRAAGARAADDPSDHYLQLWRRQLERLEHRQALEAQEAAAAAAQPAQGAPGTDGATPPDGTQPPAQGGETAPPPSGGDEVQFFD